MVKRIVLLCGITAMLLFVSACEDGNCNQCGFEPNSQQMTTYIDADGDRIVVAFWADSDGCVKLVNCP